MFTHANSISIETIFFEDNSFDGLKIKFLNHLLHFSQVRYKPTSQGLINWLDSCWLRGASIELRLVELNRRRGNYTRPRPSWIHRILLWYIYMIIRLSSSWLEIHTMRYFYQLGFNIEYQNWPSWIEGHRNVSLSIISEYWSIFGLEIFDGFVKIKFRYLEKDEWNFDHVRFKNCEMWILRIENN